MSPGGIFHGTARDESLEFERNEPTEPITWRLGILTDNEGHAHLGAVLAGRGDDGHQYVDLLSPVGAASTAELDLTHVLILGRRKHVAELRRIAKRCIENERLRRQLVELTDLSECRR